MEISNDMREIVKKYDIRTLWPNNPTQQPPEPNPLSQNRFNGIALLTLAKWSYSVEPLSSIWRICFASSKDIYQEIEGVK